MGANLSKEGWFTGLPKERGFTERGRTVLSQEPKRLDTKVLEQFPEFVAFREGNVGTENEHKSITPDVSLAASKTPFEVLEDAYTQIQSTFLHSNSIDISVKCFAQRTWAIIASLTAASPDPRCSLLTGSGGSLALLGILAAPESSGETNFRYAPLREGS
jgi:restriction endonuclease Mrr